MQHPHGADKWRVAQQFAPPLSREEAAVVTVIEIELQQVVRQLGVEDTVFAETPLAVEYIATAEQRPKIERVAGGPAFQQLELTLTRPAREVMATTLQLQPPG